MNATLKKSQRKKLRVNSTQESVLLPALWNASYEIILYLEVSTNLKLIRYADDVTAWILNEGDEKSKLKLN